MSFAFIGRNPTYGRMRAKSVVKALNISKNSILSLCPGAKADKMAKLAFEAAEKVLRNGIVVGIALNGRNLSFQKNPAQ